MHRSENNELTRIFDNIFMRISLIALLVCMLVFSAQMMMQYNDLRERADALRAEIDASEHKIESLQTQLDAPFDREYVIKIAKEKLNLSLPQEIVFYNDLNEAE